MYSTGLSRLFVLKLMGKCFMSWRSDNKELMGRWCRCTGSVVDRTKKDKKRRKDFHTS